MTSFRMFEIILYSMVSLLPYLGLALYPFEDKFRMSKIKLSGCIVILTVIQSALGIYATMCSQEQKALFSLLSTVCYGGFYFLARVCEIKSVNRHSMISDGAVSS